MLDFCGESHIIKVIKVEANESIGSPKRKDPLPELQSPKGGLFAPCTLPKPLPLGEVSPEATERASPARKSRRRSDRQALCQSDTIAVSELFGSGLALSVSSPCSSPAPPKGEPLACRSGSPSYNLSVSLRSTAPLVGEPLAERKTLNWEGKLCGMPKPPLGRGGGIAKQ